MKKTEKLKNIFLIKFASGRMNGYERSLVAFVWFGIVFLMAAVTMTGVSGIESGSSRSATAQEGHMEAVATIRPESPQLSDTVTMTLSVTGDSAWTVRFPEQGERYGDFIITGTHLSDPVIVGDRETREVVITMTPTETGERILPPIPLTASHDGQTTSWSIPSGRITVTSRYSGDVTADDLSGTAGSIRSFPWLPVGLILLAIVAIAFIWYQRSRHVNLPIMENVIPPWQRALTQLEELMTSKLYARDVKAFYLRLTGIVRWCIEETTGLRAPEQTTEEFLDSLSYGSNRNVFNQEQREGLKSFLEFSDLVKFAKFRPTLDEIYDGANRARRVIEEQRADEHINEEGKGEERR